MSRRRAAGGPAEKTFATLVGLELRPRRLREAAAFWQRANQEKGVQGRDALWEHPDLLPSADDLDNLEAFWQRDSAAPFGVAGSLEAELAAVQAESASASEEDTPADNTIDDDVDGSSDEDPSAEGKSQDT
jgi:hypothetical protein